MQALCKVELFDRNYNFVAKAALERPVIYEDYLTLEHNAVQFACPGKITKGLFAQITDCQGKMIYQGLVADVKPENEVLVLKLAPLLSLLDIGVEYDRKDLQTGPIEEFLAQVILKTYSTNADSLQNIPGVACATTSSTRTFLNLKSNVHELWDICTSALTVYGVAITAELIVAKKNLLFTIGAVPGIKPIETSLQNCLEKNIVLGDSYGELNKITYINKNDEDEKITYYLHPDGKVDIENKNRITPVFFSSEYVESDEFFDDAKTRAMETLTPKKHNNLIELTFKKSDRLVHPEQWKIGQQAVIIIDDNAYPSMLTGRECNGALVKLCFGCIRTELTKKIAIERRKRDANKN